MSLSELLRLRHLSVAGELFCLIQQCANHSILRPQISEFQSLPALCVPKAGSIVGWGTTRHRQPRTYIITDDGDLLSAGSNLNANGQLGRADSEDAVARRVTAATHQLLHVACGSEHVLASFAVGRTTEVWGWGWNEHSLWTEVLHTSTSNITQMSSERSTEVGENGPKSLPYGNTPSSLKSRSKRSLRLQHDAETPTRRPIDTFRSTVKKIMTMQRSTSIISAFGAGAEPGVDPRRASMEVQYRNVHQDCVVEVIDYSAVSASFLSMRNTEFVNWSASPKSKRPPWVKVRWINVAGTSWDIIKALSLTHELHPLALEDVLHTRPDNLSKAEYYLHHLFLRVLCHEVDEGSRVRRATQELQEPSAPDSKDDARQRKVDEAKLEALKEGTIKVAVSPLFVFLFRDGTVISISQDVTPELMVPITQRLRRADGILRTSADPSLLVQSLLGLVVDKAVQVIDAYHDQISKIEHQILLKPKPSTVRKLHIVSGDLVLHKRTLDPIKTLVYGLRRYDVDRCAALIDESDPAMKGQPVVGFMSHKSKIYLADVYDHTEYILSTLDMIAGIGDSLTDYSFNMASYSMNDTMRALTTITIICLPLTFVSGYFGMNFSEVTWKSEWTDILFWVIALPCVMVISPLFIVPDIKKMIHYLRTRRLLKVPRLRPRLVGD
ncbi:hypothetical protein B0H15DRAFT_806274 [Mycena belliarum]|uniref:Uncharacterized protein n=1 Tax=Mycena belliarum TaxID=1033014 RepID=A0AAD6XF46_9AGAR|nr:hypothetical protein B0H15DRAFT_806274 [Mycena belliae]